MGIVRRAGSKSIEWHGREGRRTHNVRIPTQPEKGSAVEKRCAGCADPSLFRRRNERPRKRERRPNAGWSADAPTQGGPGPGGACFVSGMAAITRNVHVPQCRHRRAATDSITAVTGGGTSSAARAAASPARFRAGDSRP